MYQDTIGRILNNINSVILGKRSELELAFIALLSQGHLLIEDVPGTGKTTLAKAIAKSFGCVFKRIQFAPDILPSDITGTSIYNQKSCEFEFRPGPIFGQIILADEINRASPKTQAALLECMEERQVTIEGISHVLPKPFFIMATENPVERDGTFPLPEAELDRFLVHLKLGYPSFQDEISIMEQQKIQHPIDRLEQVASAEELLQLQEATREIYVDKLVKEYIVRIVEATRNHPDVFLGASPRGSLALFRTAQARALINGRDFVVPDDVKALATETLSHRLMVKLAARTNGYRNESVILGILDKVPVPGGKPVKRPQQIT
ncbi:MAG: MoxR family ATPase [Dehalococcoidia bacterium]|nr:MoxR family ATPase [Dehalococcoidia bacterium]MDZ4247458.1 MoxR family ATPase [Dehalococcoidia bacterium]